MARMSEQHLNSEESIANATQVVSKSIEKEINWKKSKIYVLLFATLLAMHVIYNM